MKAADTFKSWSLFKKTIIAIGALVAALVAIWQGIIPVYSWFEPAALAQIQHTELASNAMDGRTEIIASMNRRDLQDVRDDIEDLESLIIETKYRADLSAQQKEALISSYKRKITRLKQIEECLMRGELNCY